MVLSIIFLEDKQKIILHLSIFYKYQVFSTPYLFLDTAATSTRKFTQKSEIFRHKTSHMVLSILFLEDKHTILYCIYQYFMSINSFFNTVSVSRYSRPITVIRDPDQLVPAFFFLIMLFKEKHVPTNRIMSMWGNRNHGPFSATLSPSQCNKTEIYSHH